MNWQTDLPDYSINQVETIIWLEANPGENRREYLRRWLDDAKQKTAITWLLPCNAKEGGPWAGLNNLFADLVPQIQKHAPDLITKHDYELVHILPTLRRTITVRYLSLTDVVAEDEQTRSHPADRVFRIVHGLINLLAAWCERSGYQYCAIACDYFDDASALVRYFFAELMRRWSQQMNLTLLLCTSIETSETFRSQFTPKYLEHFVKLNLIEQEVELPSKKMSRLASKLENHIGEDTLELEAHLPKLIYYWLHSNQPQKAIAYQVRACILFAKRGFYEDALDYGKAAFKQLKHYYPNDNLSYYKLVERMYTCYVTLNKFEEALSLLEDAIKSSRDPDFLYSCYYMIAILYARYFSDRDYVKAEVYLKKGLKEIAQSNLSENIKVLRLVSYHRGISLIRFRQGKAHEAITIAKSCYEELRLRLGLNSHTLKQSVLLSIIAQVYNSIGNYQEAINYFTLAISMDYNYSEYYNHRGKVYFNMGYLDEALIDFLKAIELSPPYPEVWTNLGQCYRLKTSFQKAVDAYSVALDLNPFQSLALVGRAQAFEMLGQPEKAIADYSSALALDSNQSALLANRAVLYYDTGRYQDSLRDLNSAIMLSPEISDLYQNRAIVLAALGRFEEAV